MTKKISQVDKREKLNQFMSGNWEQDGAITETHIKYYQNGYATTITLAQLELKDGKTYMYMQNSTNVQLYRT